MHSPDKPTTSWCGRPCQAERHPAVYETEPPSSVVYREGCLSRVLVRRVDALQQLHALQLNLQSAKAALADSRLHNRLRCRYVRMAALRFGTFKSVGPNCLQVSTPSVRVLSASTKFVLLSTWRNRPRMPSAVICIKMYTSASGCGLQLCTASTEVLLQEEWRVHF